MMIYAGVPRTVVFRLSGFCQEGLWAYLIQEARKVPIGGLWLQRPVPGMAFGDPVSKWESISTVFANQ